MCGITGIFHFDNNRVVNSHRLRRMTDKIRHRGPDGEGYYLNRNIGFGHRRLTIIDIETGDQPMFNSDKSIVLVFNGEIYNYIELRDELVNLGHYFMTTSDTEVVIKAYEQWGVECQNKFNGMWAFALWDVKKQQLFLSRDRIGEKPLNYAVYENTLVFSSEIKSLFEYGVPREIRPELIEIYLVLTYIPGPDTFYKNIFKLKPGHFIISNSQGISEHKYWDLPEIDENNMLKDKQTIYNEFACLFEDSVKIRMRSDVPFGAFLSGGLDSSSIVGLMSKISPHKVETFTIGFPEKEFDESNLAKLVADKFHTKHHLGTVNKSTIEDAIWRSANFFDEPFGDNSAIATYQVSNFAVKNVKMVLTGDGGDELLSGYGSYAGIKFSNLYSKLPMIMQKTLPKAVGLLSKGFNGGIRYKLNHIANVFETSNYPFIERYSQKAAFIPLPIIKKLTKPIKGIIGIEDFLSDIMNKTTYKDDFYKLMYIHLKYTLPDDFLVKVDRMSMANSLETRAPFLDYRLIEFMIGVDKNIKLQGWERKSILRNTIGKTLPTQLLRSPKKGFVVPVREWFKEETSAPILELNNIKKICDESTIDEIINSNTRGSMDNGYFLWSLIMLDQFVK
jgi:asparagine synthase (glutamine-hydrolysing)